MGMWCEVTHIRFVEVTREVHADDGDSDRCVLDASLKRHCATLRFGHPSGPREPVTEATPRREQDDRGEPHFPVGVPSGERERKATRGWRADTIGA